MSLILMFFTFTGSSVNAKFSVSQKNLGNAVTGGTLTSNQYTLPPENKAMDNNGRTGDFVSENEANLARENKNVELRRNHPPIRLAQNRFDFSSTILNRSVGHTGTKEGFPTCADLSPHAAETVLKYGLPYFSGVP